MPAARQRTRTLTTTEAAVLALLARLARMRQSMEWADRVLEELCSRP